MEIYHLTSSKSLHKLIHNKRVFLTFMPSACERSFGSEWFCIKFWLFWSRRQWK